MQSIQDRMLGDESEDESDTERIQTVDGEASDKGDTVPVEEDDVALTELLASILVYYLYQARALLTVQYV